MSSRLSRQCNFNELIIIVRREEIDERTSAIEWKLFMWLEKLILQLSMYIRRQLLLSLCVSSDDYYHWIRNRVFK